MLFVPNLFFRASDDALTAEILQFFIQWFVEDETPWWFVRDEGFFDLILKKIEAGGLWTGFYSISASTANNSLAYYA
jgi:hypothetical protein